MWRPYSTENRTQGIKHKLMDTVTYSIHHNIDIAVVNHLFSTNEIHMKSTIHLLSFTCTQFNISQNNFIVHQVPTRI